MEDHNYSELFWIKYKSFIIKNAHRYIDQFWQMKKQHIDGQKIDGKR